MTNIETQIVTMFETGGLTPDEIGSQVPYDVTSIKACLMTYSEKYKSSESSEADEVEFTKSQQKKALRVIDSCMDSADEYVALGAAKIVIKDKQVKHINNFLKKAGVSIVQFNERLLKAQEAVARAKGKVIDIEPQSPAPQQLNNNTLQTA